MKLPTILEKVFQKKPSVPRELFLSCVLGEEWIQVSTWYLGEKKTEGTGSILKLLTKNTWEERQRQCREAIGEIQQPLGTKLTKVVLGLPGAYLTSGGDIEESVRPHLKTLLKDLGLSPLGFVPIHQAIIYALKREEGIPPNVILLVLSKKDGWLYLYKIGQMAGVAHLDLAEGVVLAVEGALQSFTEIEVLPSRILLLGGDKAQLENTKGELLKHPWQTRANFLHFPKIEVLSEERIVASISLAGASEVAVGMRDESLAGEGTADSREREVAGEPHAHKDTISPSVPDEIRREAAEAMEEANVVVVNPDELGFSKNRDILESPRGVVEKIEEPTLAEDQEENEIAPKKRRVVPFSLPRLSKLPFPKIPMLSLGIFRGFSLSAVIFVASGVVLLAILFGLLYWFVPRATLSVYVVPKTVSDAPTIRIDTEATSVDPAKKVVPGKKQEKSLTGEKVIPVTGKKKVGDPAKGTVTIYNKSSSLRTFKKGTILTSGSLQFSLDSDTQVATASENLVSGTVTFGKANATITAMSIGPTSNLSANTEFTFKDIASSVAVARNDQALTGGTSRDAIVVTRADYDALVKILSDELTEKAQQELSGGLGMTDKLIPATVKTTVTDKKFTQELDQEAQELQGSLTVAVTGISYNTGDFLTYLKTIASQQIPSGYTLKEEETKVDIGKSTIAKDGTITVETMLAAMAVPTIDTAMIQKEATGKTVTALQEYLRSIEGVGGVAVTFQYSPIKTNLPINRNNISVSVALQK